MDERRELKKVRLSDIAEELNVSTVSVSNALNGRKGVSDELRQKIFDLAEEMNYKYSGAEGESERLSRRNIGVVISERYIDKSSLSFYMRMYQEIVMFVSQKDSMTLLEIMTREREEELAIPNLFFNDSVDGIIILGEMRKPYTKMLKDHNNKAVIFLDYYEDIPDTDFILSDSFNGMCAMTRLLMRSGYKKIGFIAEIPRTSSIIDRFLGYKKALQESGVSVNSEWMAEAQRDGDGKLKINFPESMPDAFVCHNDITARAAIEQLRGMGYRIPGDIGIVGFDNYPAGETDGVKLTTYDVDIRAMAEVCVNTLFRKIDRTHFVPRMRVVEGNIVIGNSHKAGE